MWAMDEHLHNFVAQIAELNPTGASGQMNVITTILYNFALLRRVLEVACYSFSLQTDYRGSFSWF
jgi:hypothetical protein